tara:strand:+ start:125 stop:298 length:174 start_codon:yes stop_codon:yes gene_type:complete
MEGWRAKGNNVVSWAEDLAGGRSQIVDSLEIAVKGNTKNAWVDAENVAKLVTPCCLQ